MNILSVFEKFTGQGDYFKFLESARWGMIT